MASIHNLALGLLVAIASLLSGNAIYSQASDNFLGIRLGPEVRTIVKEIENKTGKPIHSEFVQEQEFELASSYIDDDTGEAVVLVDSGLESGGNKLEAVIVHELLHLRLRVNNFPTFIFLPNVRTAKGRAIDVEQEHVNDLLSMIEHRVFKADMERFGVYKYIDLAGDTAADARNRKGDEDGQADAINYARAILEYKDPHEVDLVKQLFTANGWTRSLKEGAEIANVITTAEPRSPKDIESVFLRCMLVLYPMPKPAVSFSLSPDPSNKYFRRFVINMVNSGRKRP